MTPDELMRRLVEPELPGYLDKGGARLKQASEDLWPSEQHPENIYATGRSVRMFAVNGAGDREREIENRAEYSGHTHYGDNIYGRGMARGYLDRGGVPYLDQVADAEVEDEAQALLDHIAEGIRG